MKSTDFVSELWVDLCEGTERKEKFDKEIPKLQDCHTYLRLNDFFVSAISFLVCVLSFTCDLVRVFIVREMLRQNDSRKLSDLSRFLRTYHIS